MKGLLAALALKYARCVSVTTAAPTISPTP